MNSSQSTLVWFVLIASGIALIAAALLSRWVLALNRGEPAMQRISNAIQEGAEAYLARQYKTIAGLSLVVALLLYIGYAFFRPAETGTASLTAGTLALYTTVSFLFGALCSGIAGYMGMWVSIRTNIRVASAARSSVNAALQTALRGGAVSGLFTVAMSLIGVSGLFAVLHLIAPVGVSADEWTRRIPFLIVGFGFGASFVALFAQLGGGIYTKAADVGADLVGKVEAGIPEDDPRNPAVIADLVGDNVGDCAGRGADLFESTAAENIGAMILGVLLYPFFGARGVLFPLVVGAVGLLASIVGVVIVRTNGTEDPMSALNRGFYVTSALVAVAFFFLCAAFCSSRRARRTRGGTISRAGWWGSRRRSRSSTSHSTTRSTATDRCSRSRTRVRPGRRPTSSPGSRSGWNRPCSPSSRSPSRSS